MTKTDENGLVLALVGESGAGKTTTTAIIAEMGFAPIALSKHLREAAIARYGEPERAQVQELARETQAIEGDDYYARVALADPSFLQSNNVIVDGLRNMAELEYTTRAVADSGRKFFLVAVIASDETRFSRVVNRGRVGDPLLLEQFQEDDARARGSAVDGFQQNGILIEMAEHRLHNTGDIDTLHERIQETIVLARRSNSLEPSDDGTRR
ncbi:MAG: AAA family ATPase [Stappiaceae bacterium]